jgi:hypothetical protein
MVVIDALLSEHFRGDRMYGHAAIAVKGTHAWETIATRIGLKKAEVRTFVRLPCAAGEVSSPARPLA